MVCAFGLTLFLLVTSAAIAATNPLVEYRYSGAPLRDSKGQIIRRADVQRAFQRIHPCPSTGFTYGACPNWYKDHVLPLACGGQDAVSNMQWLNAAAWKTKSLWERKIYAATPPYPDTAMCANVLVL